MKHASPETIRQLEPMLAKLRRIPGLTEKKPGIYYRKSSAFLHFHDHEGAVFADVRLHPPGFDRYPATTARQQAALIRAIRATLG